MSELIYVRNVRLRSRPRSPNIFAHSYSCRGPPAMKIWWSCLRLLGKSSVRRSSMSPMAVLEAPALSNSIHLRMLKLLFVRCST